MAILRHVLIAGQGDIEAREIQPVRTVQQVGKKLLSCPFFVLFDFFHAK